MTFFYSMIDLENKGEPVDLLTLTERLKNQSLLEEAGGHAYITS